LATVSSDRTEREQLNLERAIAEAFGDDHTFNIMTDDVASVILNDEIIIGITYTDSYQEVNFNVVPNPRYKGEDRKRILSEIQKRKSNLQDPLIQSTMRKISNGFGCSSKLKSQADFNKALSYVVENLTADSICGNRSHLLNDLYKSGLPEEMIVSIVNGVDRNVKSLETITLDTMAGTKGGGVGRITFEDSIKGYVIKGETDELAAQKSALIPRIIHDKAESGDRLAELLARKVPKPLLPEPVNYNGFHITIAEDVSGKLIEPSLTETFIIDSEVRKGLDYDIVERLYFAALYHEVMEDVLAEEIDPNILRILNSEVFPTNITLDNLKERLGPHFDKVKYHFNSTIGQGYEDNTGFLAELEAKGRTIGICDNRDENYVQGIFGKYFVDFGISKKGNGDVVDISRAIMTELEICKDKNLVQKYTNSYVSMRQKIQETFRESVTYLPNTNILEDAVLKQTGIEAWRNASWMAHTGRSNKIQDRVDCARAIYSQI
jgi:hypothetical protein